MMFSSYYDYESIIATIVKTVIQYHKRLFQYHMRQFQHHMKLFQYHMRLFLCHIRLLIFIVFIDYPVHEENSLYIALKLSAHLSHN